MNIDDILDMHPHETGLVIGNGPSLAHVPAYLLEKFPTFGCNYIGRIFQPTYFVCIDSIVLTEHAAEIYPTAAGARRTFLSSLHADERNPETRRLYALPNVSFADTMRRWGNETCFTGHTAVYVALKLAFWMGFETVLLVGVDHGAGHFCPDYPAGSEPNWEGQRHHFKVAERVYRACERRIVNLSAPSELDEIFK